MAILDRIATARDDQFAARVAMLLMKLCVDVANEDPAYENHANRLHFAQLHFRAQVNTKALAAAIIANNATIQTAIDSAPNALGSNVPDGDLEFVIGGLFDNFANAYVSQ
ncbi:hypothetical protein B0G84_5754 [Paraburkholderia sp. BL8N3]|nr:hypothetical protein [Paraburkholderia sp. BL8N3]TCK36741.1 hypothetical protein B0G84_5754 [Paraburkholderia sp. BL8N3]